MYVWKQEVVFFPVGQTVSSTGGFTYVAKKEPKLPREKRRIYELIEFNIYIEC